MVTDEELKTVWGMFTDAWKFYKRYAGIQQSEDERWQQLVDEYGQIAKKYDNHNLRLRYYWRSLMNWNGFIRR